MKVSFVLLTIIMLFAIPVRTSADPQELIDDGWVLGIGGISIGELPDIVDHVTYGWGSDTIIQGRYAMYLGEQSRAWFRFADTPVYGEISFLVYDKGVSAVPAHSTYGPRWGVQNNPRPNPVPATGTANDQLMAVEITWKNFLNGNATYGFVNSNQSDVSTAASHFSQTWPGGYGGPSNGENAYRRLAGATAANPVIDTTIQVGDTPVHVPGAWARWTFSVHDGEDMTFKVADPDGGNQQSWTIIPVANAIFDTGLSTTGFNQVYFYGGNPDDRGNDQTSGLWVDAITFIPDFGQNADPWAYNFEGDSCLQRAAYGDFNCDTDVALIDLDILGRNWLVTGLDPATSYQFGDTNADGDVALLDLDALGRNWNTTTPIPEPAACTMLAIGSLAYLRRR